MGKFRSWFLLCPIILIIMELLPFGVVAYFATGPDVTIKQTFSYFDLTPLGYANIGPFLTAILTCLLLILVVAFIIFRKDKLRGAISVTSIIAVVTSVMPLMFGIKYVSVLGCCITILLLSECWLSNKLKR